MLVRQIAGGAGGSQQSIVQHYCPLVNDMGTDVWQRSIMLDGGGGTMDQNALGGHCVTAVHSEYIFFK